MRTLVISDIHANATAFEAVLKEAGEFDRTWCLGDIVGYGPDPERCIEMLQSLPELTCVMGNHDAALLRLIDVTAFNDDARIALEIQAEHISQASRDYLERMQVVIEKNGITFVHGSPRDPIWEYIINLAIARANFGYFQSQICLIGHSHIPSLFVEKEKGDVFLLQPSHGDMWRSEQRFILNPGSVGQPRDNNPRASYVIYNDEAEIWQFQRVAYDIDSVQSRIIDMGLPMRHAARLYHGM